jgi:hypothetical protein
MNEAESNRELAARIDKPVKYIDDLDKLAFGPDTEPVARRRAQAELEDIAEGHWVGHRTDLEA